MFPRAARTRRLWDLLAPRPAGAVVPRRRPRPLAVEALEDRITPAGRPVPFPVIAVAPGHGSGPVRLLDADTGAVLFQVDPFQGTSLGGVRVAVADITHDAYPDLVLAAGPGGGPRVGVYDGKTGQPVPGPLGNFFAYDPAFTGGVTVAAGDVDGDGYADVVTAADQGGGPHVRAFSGKTGAEVASFFAFEPEFRGGVRLAVGRFRPGAGEQVVLGAGPGGGPRVRVLDLNTMAPVPGPLGDFFAGPAAEAGGVYVAAGNVTGPGLSDLVVGAGAGAAPEFRVYDGGTGAAVRTVAAFAPGATGGVRVATAYVDDDDRADVVVGSGPGIAPRVKTFGGATGGLITGPAADFAPGVGDAAGGVNVAAGNDPIPAETRLQPYESILGVGQPFLMHAEVFRNLNGGYQGSYPLPTGTVEFRQNGAVVGTAPLVGVTADMAVAEFVVATGAVGYAATSYDYRFDELEATYSGDSVYVATATSALVAVGGPDVVASCPVKADPVGRAAADPGGALAGTVTAGGVRVDGTVVLPGPGLAGGAPDGLANHRGGWTNDPATADGLAGPGTVGGAAVRLLPNLAGSFLPASDPSSVLLVDAGGRRYFDRWPVAFKVTDTAFKARLGARETLEHLAAAAEYRVTDGTGRQLYFADFSAAAGGGQLLRVVDPSGGTGTVTGWTTAARADRIAYDYTAADGVSRTEAVDYTYGGNGVATATLTRQAGAGAAAAVRSIAYTYAAGGGYGGGGGTLASAVVKDAAGAALDTYLYRYYPASGGSGGVPNPPLLKYAFGPAAAARLAAYAAGVGLTAGQVPDADAAPYADHYFEYDAARRVTKHTAAGEGCSACSGGQGTYTYTYATNLLRVRVRNDWAKAATETRPDGAVATYYANSDGQPLYQDVTAGGVTLRGAWGYTADGQAAWAAGPGTVTGADPALPDLGLGGANAAYLADAAGAVTAYTYHGAAAGGAAGLLASVALKRGELGAAVPQEALTYSVAPAGHAVAVATDTVYANADGTGGRTTTAAVTWAAGTDRMTAATVTLPVVSAARNGPGVAASSAVAYDPFGRPAWTQDAAGFLGYTAYDPATGAVVKQITDVDTTQTATFAGLPAGWATPAGGGLHLTATAEVDHLGRATAATDPVGQVAYTVYNDPAHEVRTYAGWDAALNAPTGPTVVMRDDRAAGYAESLTMSAAPAVSGGRPTGTEAVSGVQSLSRTQRNLAGQAVQTDGYYSLTGLTYTASATLGTEGTHFLRTRQDYDKLGRPNRTQTPAGTVTRTESDGFGRVVSEWVGTDDVPTTGYWSVTNLAGTDMVKVAEYEYDGGGVGDGNLTKATAYPGLGAAPRVTQTWFDWRDRPVAVKASVEAAEAADVNRPITYTGHDNLGEVLSTERYDGDGVTPTVTAGVPDRPAAGLLRAKASAAYDDLGRAYRTDTSSVDPATGAVGAYTLHADAWFDLRGQVAKTAAPGGVVEKTRYDGAGRAVTAYTTDGGGDAGWADALTVTGDAVLEQAEAQYDAAGRVVLSTTRQRFHDETATGALGTPTTGVKARVSYAGMYYDLAGRPVATVDVGTNGAAAWVRPAVVPARADTALVSSTVYDAAGRAWKATDPRGLEGRTEYDLLGRTTKTVENYVDGVPSDADDKTTEYGYGPAGMTSLTARITGGGGQTTAWVYGVTTAGGSAIASNDIVGATRWPDPTSGSASAAEQDTAAVNALGQTVTATDRNGTMHALAYDSLGRVAADAVTALGTGVDGAVRRVETAYDGRGAVARVTSYAAAVAGAVVSQVQRAYNGLGQLAAEWQEHAGAVVEATTPKVQYTYSGMPLGANHSRPTGVTYPNGRAVASDYGPAGGLNDRLSRLDSLRDGAVSLEAYTYLGLGAVVEQRHPEPGVDLSYVKLAAESAGDAGDQYTGLDRFDRVVDQRHRATGTGAAVDRFQYGYDRDSNRLYRDNLALPALGEVYSYDGLNQVTGYQRGTLDAAKTGVTGTPARTQGYAYDAAGNFGGVTTDGVAQARAANRQNEVTAVAGATTPTFDAAGNMTGDETGKQLIYDGWNRLVAVKTSGGVYLASYAYDGLGRRVSETPAVGAGTDLYYSSGWQVLEERAGGVTKESYVWSPVYVDAMVSRDRDADGNSGNGLEERLYVLADANHNVTALVSASGVVLERYTYDPFGGVQVRDAAGTVKSGGTGYAWAYLHQGLRLAEISGLYDNFGRWFSPALGRFASVDPTGFAAGDVNLYRYEGNNPAIMLDPTGLSGAGNHHPYPVMLGGSDTGQPLFQLNEAQHTACESVLKKYGFHNHNNLKLNDAARANWAALTEVQQRAIIAESLKAAGVHDTLIKGNIEKIMAGATPGKYVKAINRAGTNKNGGLITKAMMDEAGKLAKLATALGGVLIMGGVGYANDTYVATGEEGGMRMANKVGLMMNLRLANNDIGLPKDTFTMKWRDGSVLVRNEMVNGISWIVVYQVELKADGTFKSLDPLIRAGELPRDR